MVVFGKKVLFESKKGRLLTSVLGSGGRFSSPRYASGRRRAGLFPPQVLAIAATMPLSRAQGWPTFPASIQLVAAMNPCPCRILLQ
jgi:hypothetical protein